MHDAQSIELAVFMRMALPEIDSMSYLESISIIEVWSKHEMGEQRFQAALHDKSLK